MDINNLDNFIFQTFLVLCRVGGIFMFFPGLSERYIFTRTNLVIAFFFSLILVQLIPGLPNIPSSPAIFAIYLLIEIMVGIVINLAVQIIFLSIHISGALMSTQSGMNAANVFDPQQGDQVPIVTNILSMFCLAAIFSTDTHHIIFSAISHSYDTFPIGKNLEMSEMSEFITKVISNSFLLGLKISAPFLVINIAITVANGLLARLMPSFQVFFVMTPAQIMMLFLLLLITLNPILEAVILNMQETMGGF